jgi:uncharacterized protein YaiI (UPF0178 family)
MTIFIDADACPVKQEIYRVAERHALKASRSKSSSSPTVPSPFPETGFLPGRRTQNRGPLLLAAR